MTVYIEQVERRDTGRAGDVDGRYGNMTRPQLQLFADELRQQVNSDVIFIIIIIIISI